jgi:hypothetical protein
MRRPAPILLTLAGLAALAWTACVQVPADRREPATFPRNWERDAAHRPATAAMITLEPPPAATAPFTIPASATVAP